MRRRKSGGDCASSWRALGASALVRRACRWLQQHSAGEFTTDPRRVLWRGRAKGRRTCATVQRAPPCHHVRVSVQAAPRHQPIPHRGCECVCVCLCCAWAASPPVRAYALLLRRDAQLLKLRGCGNVNVAAPFRREETNLRRKMAALPALPCSDITQKEGKQSVDWLKS